MLLPVAPAELKRKRYWRTCADAGPAALVTIGLASLYLPTFWGLAHTIWSNDEQGHGPIVLSVSSWLLLQKRVQLLAQPRAPAPLRGMGLLLVGLSLYILGRSQSIAMLEVGSLICVLAGILLVFCGMAAVQVVWFPLFFLLFMIPLPGAMVATVTVPLKNIVSAVAEGTLHTAGFPIGRTGAVLVVGQYKLLIADACAGLHSLFSLEALGLLYLNLMRYVSATRNVLLAFLIIPISLCSNVARVIVLILVTYFLGDQNAQGFIHGFAGLFLFLFALVLIFLVDKAIGHRFVTTERSA